MDKSPMDKPHWLPHWFWKARDEVVGAAVVAILVASIEPVLAWWQERPPNPWGAMALLVVAGFSVYLYARARPRNGPSSEPQESFPRDRVTKLKIHSALWGSGPTTDKHVEGELERFISGDSLSILASIDNFGDPAEGDDKRLAVEYSYDNGPIKNTSRPQSRRLFLPEDPWLLHQISQLESQVAETRQKVAPILEFQYEHVCRGELFGPGPGEPEVVYVRNTQISVGNIARNLTARVQYTHSDGTSFTMTKAVWLSVEQHDDGVTISGYKGSVDLKGNEAQKFVLLFKTPKDHLMVFEDFSFPIGMCATGRWTVRITIYSDRGNELEGTIILTVLPDKRFEWSKIT